MKQPLHIHFVLPVASMAGGVRVVAIYAERLQARGHMVTVTSVPRRLPWKRRIKDVLAGRGYRTVMPEPTSHLTGRPVEHRILPEARPVVASDLTDADVVIATWWKTARWVADLPLEKGAKVYFIQHDERHVGGDAQTVPETWRLPMTPIVVAQWIEPLLREAGVTRPIHVVPNAVDLDQFHAPERGKQPRPTVGLMYSDAHFKGADLALEAVRLARQSVPDLQLVAFGKDATYEAMPLPPGSGTHFEQSPPQDRLRELYARCDAWLFASRCEGFGLPILEAMACRTPVIGTPAGAAPELLPSGGGTLVPLEDPAAMARAIVENVRLSDAAWRARSDAALAVARATSWDQATDQFEAALYAATGARDNAAVMRTAGALRKELV